jgi:hypothetical protein
MASNGKARRLRRCRSRPGHHPSVAWRRSLESGLSSKVSRVVRRRVVGKVPTEATRWRPILRQAGFGEGALEKYPPRQLAGALLYRPSGSEGGEGCKALLYPCGSGPALGSGGRCSSAADVLHCRIPQECNPSERPAVTSVPNGAAKSDISV